MTESEYKTFIAARYVAGLVVRHLAKNKVALSDQRHFPILPTCNQLRFGLCISLDPCGASILNTSFSLWTPWGTWCFCDAHLEIRELPLDIDGMRLTRIQEGSELYQSAEDRIYAVHEATRLVFSKPKRRPRDKFLEEETAQNKWDEMSMRYFERNPRD